MKWDKWLGLFVNFAFVVSARNDAAEKPYSFQLIIDKHNKNKNSLHVNDLPDSNDRDMVITNFYTVDENGDGIDIRTW